MAESAPPRPGYGVLLRHPRFGPFLAAQAVTQIGDVLYDLGVVWLTLQATGSVFAAGAVAAASFLPSLLVSPIAGTLADRIHPRTILIWDDLIRAVIVGLLAILTFVSAYPPTWLIFGVTFLLGLGTRFYIPARFAWLPCLIEPPLFAPANALMTLLSNSRAILGGLATLLVLGTGQPGLVFLLDALSFVGAAWLTALVRDRTPFSPAERAGLDGRSWWARARRELVGVLTDVRDVFRQPGSSQPLFLVALDSLLLSGVWFAGAPLLTVVWAGLGGSELFASLQMAYGIGVALGCYFVGWYLVRGGRADRLMSAAYLLRTAIYAALALDGLALAPLGLPLVLVTGLALPAVTVSVPTMLQQVSRQTGLGRVFGVYTLLSAGLVSLSILLYGWLATRLSLGGFFGVGVVCSGIMAAAALLLARTPDAEGRATDRRVDG
jgi:MFS family permease